MIAHLVQSMPKAELHIHLESSINVGTLLELADRHDALDQLPAQDEEGLRHWFLFHDFPHFVEIYMMIQWFLRTADDFSTIVYRSSTPPLSTSTGCWPRSSVTARRI
jgi:aminodeoxyfutalosine deaminase